MSNSLKAALWTAFFTFLGTTLAALLGLLSAVEGWVNGSDPTLQDDLSLFVTIVLSAAIAAASGLVNWAIRAVQVKTGKGNPPVYE